MAGVERAEPDRPVAPLGVVAEQRAPAAPAEQLREALLGLPRPDLVLAGEDPQRARGDRAWAEAAAPVRRWQRVQWQ